MVLNYIWLAFFIIAFVVACIKLFLFGDTAVFPNMVQATFDMAKTAVMDIALPLAGVMTLWLGLMRIGERAGAINFLARIVGPFFSKLFPGVPKDHPANGHIIMNFSANMLGLDNAATPLGLKAMNSLQELNPDKERASNAQIMFLVLNTSGLTLIPVSIMALRAAQKAVNPTDVFIPILLATYCSTLAGLIFVSIRQRINLFQPVVLAWLVSISAIVFGIGYYFSRLSATDMETQSKIFGTFVIFTIIVAFLAGAVRKRVNAFEAFIEGAKEGFETSVKIIPYLVAMLVGIAVFRASGTLDYIIMGIASLFQVPAEVANALPTAFMKPLSGSGSRAMMLDAIGTYGVDSFTARLTGIFQGAADTTFYIVALYFGSVGIKHTRYAITGGLIADLFGVIAGIFIGYIFFTSAPTTAKKDDLSIVSAQMVQHTSKTGIDSARFQVVLHTELSSADIQFHNLWIGNRFIEVKAIPMSSFRKLELNRASFGKEDIVLLTLNNSPVPSISGPGSSRYFEDIKSKNVHFHKPFLHEGVALIEYSVNGEYKFLLIEKWD